MFEFNFEWDPAKAASNARKHSVTFDNAATVFQDEFMRSFQMTSTAIGSSDG